ncbi:MAG TPA: sugar transferase [Anaerolineae bacterium]|nr:sugar transferase [Anaerolineae bacterium]
MHSPNRLTEISSVAAVRAPRWSLQRSQVRWLLILGDLFWVNVAALVALWLGIQRSTWWLAVGSWDSFTAWFLFLSVIWFVSAQVMDLYDLRVAGLPRRAVSATLVCVLGMLAVYLVVYFIAAPQTLPRHLIGFFSVIAAVLLSAWRGLFALALGAGPLARRVAVVGDTTSAQALLYAIRENAPGYYSVVTTVDAQSLEGTARLLNAAGLDEVIVSAQDDLSDEWLAALVACREQGVQVANMAAVYEELTGRVPVEHVGKTWSVLLPLDQDATRGLNGFMKRALDILLAGIALLLLLPFLPFIALAIWFNSRGIILLRQARVGQNGRIFTLYKFRTMIADAEPPGVALWAEEDDPRVTPVGKFLRRFKLDEVPQFWNVLRGEMSLVGPRPERPEIVDNLQREIPFYRLRHVVRPGLTGWAAIRFRYGRSVNDALVKLQYDLYYIKHQSLTLDALILIRTLGAVLAPPEG